MISLTLFASLLWEYSEGHSLLVAVQSVKNFLYGVSPSDTVTLLATTALLTVVALVAAFLPSIRAASVDPISALRAE